MVPAGGARVAPPGRGTSSGDAGAGAGGAGMDGAIEDAAAGDSLNDGPLADASEADALDSGASEMGAADAGVDAPAVPTFECGPARPKYAGSLCGPPDRPCAVLQDDVLPNSVGFHSDIPSLFLDEHDGLHVLFTAAYSEVPNGFFAEPDPASGAWSVLALPLRYRSGGLGRGPDGAWLALVDAETYTSTLLWRGSDPASWTTIWSQPMDATFAPTSTGVVSDRNGCVHAAMGTYYGRWSGAWTVTPLASLPGDYTTGTVLALSPKGTPNVIARHDSMNDDRSSLTWEIPGSTPEIVSSETRYRGARYNLLAVTSAADQRNPDVVHVFYDEDTPVRWETNARWVDQLLYARRDPGHWWVRKIDDGGGTWVGDCYATVLVAGLTCHRDDVTIKPIAMIASDAPDGDVRFFYTRVHTIYDQTVVCGQDPSMPCVWSGPSHFETEVVMAWPDGTVTGSAVLLRDIYPFGASAALDSAGNIHLVFSDETSYQLQGADYRQNPIHHVVIGPP